MKRSKIIWRFAVGGGTTAVGWLIVRPDLNASMSSITVLTVTGIGLIAVGISVLAGAFD